MFQCFTVAGGETVESAFEYTLQVSYFNSGNGARTAIFNMIGKALAEVV